MHALCVLLALLALAEGQVDNNNNNSSNATDQVTIHYTEPPVETSTLGIHGYPGFKELPGGRIKGQRILERSRSPFLVREDLYIEKTGELIVEPGVEIHFAPMIGITVRGVITAKVNNTVERGSSLDSLILIQMLTLFVKSSWFVD